MNSSLNRMIENERQKQEESQVPRQELSSDLRFGGFEENRVFLLNMRRIDRRQSEQTGQTTCGGRSLASGRRGSLPSAEALF